MNIQTVTEKRNNTFKELNFAKEKVKNKKISLEENLEYINNLLFTIKRVKKAKYCLNYLRKYWNQDIYLKEKLEDVENQLKDYLYLYEKTVLERKVLKAQLKQAQKVFSKKQKSITRFYKKYYN